MTERGNLRIAGFHTQQPRGHLRSLQIRIGLGLLPARVTCRDRVIEERVDRTDGRGDSWKGTIGTRERVGHGDVSTGRATEGGGVCSARRGWGCLQTRMRACVPGGRGVDLGVAGEVEEGRVDSAEERDGDELHERDNRVQLTIISIFVLCAAASLLAMSFIFNFFFFPLVSSARSGFSGISNMKSASRGIW